MSKKKEKPSPRVLEKIKKMYANYGISIDFMEDGELEKVAEYYLINRDKLDDDYLKSLELKGKFSEEDLI